MHAVTKGFKDLLHFGNQTRPRVFDLEIKMRDVLYDEVVEVDKQVPTPCSLNPSPGAPWLSPGAPKTCCTSATRCSPASLTWRSRCPMCCMMRWWMSTSRCDCAHILHHGSGAKELVWNTWVAWCKPHY